MRRKKKDEIKKRKTDLRFIRKRYCRFCRNKNENIFYRNVDLLANFISERGRIIPGRISGNCAIHQRKVARAIKRARELALLPFIAE